MIGELHDNSWMRLPGLFPEPEAARDYFKGCRSYEGANFDEGGGAVTTCTPQFICYHPHSVLSYQPALATFNDPMLLDTIKAFLGREPVLYSLNAWWSFPAAAPAKINVQHFHRDTDDRKFLALFTYLTDVLDEDGPHQIIEGSHDPDRFPPDTFTNAMGEDYSRRMAERYGATSITGPAGTMFLTNARAIHRGLVPRHKPRLMLWARYGFGSNSNSMDRFCETMPASLIDAKPTSRLRHVNRLLVDYDQ